MPTTFNSINAYIKSCPKEVQPILQKIRETIQEACIEAEEAISYAMPAFKLEGKVLVYFSAWKNHIGFYALPSGTAAFQKELTNYHTAKGSIQFPLDKPMPYALIKKIVKFRIKEIQAK